ncbi:outer membrane lipoprotein carrier protein LolA [Capnocytophaga sputigena]|uniref:LolA family protein n=1 Tax=Capnocytophaga sputigena TaxID=1019 RepID=UPI0028EF5C29|nr:outer membrane lipoprotein carrier protein LolA [Capnocytophaga sputigena]
MKKLLIFLICVAPLTISAQALTEAQIRDFKTQTMAKNKSIQTMQADFTQKKHLDFMSKDIETLGKMAFSKPDKLNWQYTKPYQYRIIFQKDNITVNDAGNVSQMKSDNKVFKKINNLIVSSISGDMFNEKEFSMTFTKSGKSTLVKLLPKDKTLLKYVSEIHLYFDVDSVVERVKLIEPSKDYTEILFNNKKLNTKIDEANFKM